MQLHGKYVRGHWLVISVVGYISTIAISSWLHWDQADSMIIGGAGLLSALSASYIAGTAERNSKKYAEKKHDILFSMINELVNKSTAIALKQADAFHEMSKSVSKKGGFRFIRIQFDPIKIFEKISPEEIYSSLAQNHKEDLFSEIFSLINGLYDLVNTGLDEWKRLESFYNVHASRQRDELTAFNDRLTSFRYDKTHPQQIREASTTIIQRFNAKKETKNPSKSEYVMLVHNDFLQPTLKLFVEDFNYQMPLDLRLQIEQVMISTNKLIEIDTQIKNTFEKYYKQAKSFHERGAILSDKLKIASSS